MRDRLFFLGIALGLTAGCQTTDPVVACQAIQAVTAPNTCYQARTGLVLTADASPTATLTWVIAPFADTLIQGVRRMYRAPLQRQPTRSRFRIALRIVSPKLGFMSLKEVVIKGIR